MIPLSVFPIFY